MAAARCQRTPLTVNGRPDSAHTDRMTTPDSEPRPWDSRWATSPAGAAWRAAHPPPLADQGPLTVRRSFAWGSLVNAAGMLRNEITLDPPPADAAPRLDATAARDTYTHRGVHMYGRTGPTMHLALLDGSKLVYLFHADHVGVVWGGPAGRPAPAEPAFCVALGLLDAMTGEWIMQAQMSE